MGDGCCVFQWKTRCDWLETSRRSDDWRSSTTERGEQSVMICSTSTQQEWLVSALALGTSLLHVSCKHTCSGWKFTVHTDMSMSASTCTVSLRGLARVTIRYITIEEFNVDSKVES